MLVFSAGANPSFIATQMGHEDSRRVYVVYAKWIGDMGDQVTIITNRITTGLPHHAGALRTRKMPLKSVQLKNYQ
jgi:integrase